MATDDILPTKHLMQVRINLDDFSGFKSIWKNQKVLDFYCLGKQVIGNYVLLDIRAMRINEFVQILNDYGVKWTLN
jgi:hypothetical protein